MSEHIRQAGERDAPAVAELLHRAYEPIRALRLSWPAAKASVEDVRTNIVRNECYVLERDGAVAATLTHSLGGEVRDATGLPFVKWFAVEPLLQGSGIGSRLMEWVERSVLLGKHRAPAVTLATAERHPWLVAMYRRRGYETVLTYDPGNGDGQMHLMRKILDIDLYRRYILTNPDDIAAKYERTRPAP